MPMQRKLYPSNWKQISAAIRKRANNRCEWPGCGIENGAVVEGKRGPYKVVLTVAHVNHDPSDCRESNLFAWCQIHHLRWDIQQHTRNAAATRRRKQIDAGQQPLFDEGEKNDDDETVYREADA